MGVLSAAGKFGKWMLGYTAPGGGSWSLGAAAVRTVGTATVLGGGSFAGWQAVWSQWGSFADNSYLWQHETWPIAREAVKDINTGTEYSQYDDGGNLQYLMQAVRSKEGALKKVNGNVVAYLKPAQGWGSDTNQYILDSGNRVEVDTGLTEAEYKEAMQFREIQVRQEAQKWESKGAWGKFRDRSTNAALSTVGITSKHDRPKLSPGEATQQMVNGALPWVLGGIGLLAAAIVAPSLPLVGALIGLGTVGGIFFGKDIAKAVKAAATPPEEAPKDAKVPKTATNDPKAQPEAPASLSGPAELSKPAHGLPAAPPPKAQGAQPRL